MPRDPFRDLDAAWPADFALDPLAPAPLSPWEEAVLDKAKRRPPRCPEEYAQAERLALSLRPPSKADAARLGETWARCERERRMAVFSAMEAAFEGNCMLARKRLRRARARCLRPAFHR